MFETCLIIATILHLAALDVMDSDHKFCTICSKRHISKPSIEWCSECNQAFCVECSECHRLMSTTENHMTVPIDSYDELRASVLSISNMCEDHNETYHLYCQSHDKLLCPTCIEDHSECKDIKSINKITKNIKNSESFNEVRMSLEDMDINIDKMILEIQTNKTRIKNYPGIIAQQMSAIREKINKHLDTLEERLKEELSQLERKAVIDMQLTLKDLEEKKLRNARKRKQMQDITTYASDLHTFIGLKKLSSDTATYVASLQSLLENRSLDKVEIALKLDENITNFSNRINTFGSVQLQKIPGNIRLESQKNKQAQIIEERSIDDIVVKLVNTMNTKGDSIMGCEFSPGGKMVFSNFSFKLKDASDFIAVFDSDCTHLHNISVNPNYAFDVVALDEKHVAVTSPKQNESCIMLIDICSKEVTRIKTKSECRSITVSDGNFLSIAPKLGILSINAKNGNILKTIKNRLHMNTSLTSFNSKLYFTNRGTNTISCCDIVGTTVWTFTDDTVIKDPIGIAVDHKGNVYVTNQALNNVVVISPDGNRSKQLLSQSNGLNKPRAIQFDRKRNRLLVANEEAEAFLYDISY